MIYHLILYFHKSTLNKSLNLKTKQNKTKQKQQQQQKPGISGCL